MFYTDKLLKYKSEQYFSSIQRTSLLKMNIVGKICYLDRRMSGSLGTDNIYTTGWIKNKLPFNGQPTTTHKLEDLIVRLSNLKYIKYTWWMLFQKRDVRTKLDIYDFFLLIRSPAHGEVYSIQHYVIKWLATGRWFPPSTPVSSTNNSYHHDITEIVLQVALSTMNQTTNYSPEAAERKLYVII